VFVQYAGGVVFHIMAF